MWICIVPCREHTCVTPVRRSGMVRVFKGSQFYLHTPRSWANGIPNEPYLLLPSQPKLVLIYRPREMEG